MRIDADNVEDYLTQIPPRRQAALRQIRDLVLATAPDLEENLTYGMPTYWVNGHALCAFASQKHHMSLYLDTELLARHREALGHLNCGKSCIRFTRLERLPMDTIATILTATYARQKALAEDP